MASRGQSLTLTYVAWDTSANAGKTGDVANHTLRWVKDGTSAAPTNSAAVSEVDATNAPGLYMITLTATEATCDVGVLCGKSSTSNVSIMPLVVTFEQLPTAAAGQSTGLPTVSDIPAASAIASAVMGSDVDGKTLQAAMRIIAAVVSGKVSGAGTTTETFKGLDGTTTRVTVTVDSNGNRSAVVYA